MTIRAAKYRRISDDREGDELGVTRQSQDLDAFARKQKYVVVDDYADNDRSASTRARRDRPEYQRMLRDARAGKFDVVIAYTSSRLTRRPREFEDLIELAQGMGVRFEYIRSPSFDLNTADGRQIARMLAAADAAESERNGERVSRAIRQRAEQGRSRSGFTSTGYVGDTVVEVEAALVREAYETVLAGGTLRGIARFWNAAGMTTRHGNPWRAQTVGNVLRNPRNAGIVALGGEVLPVKAAWPAIVEPDLWHAVAAILADPARRHTPGGAPRYLLTGVATCGVGGCGAPMHGGMTSHGVRYRTIKCSASRHLDRKAEPIEDYVTGAVLGYMKKPGFRRLFRAERPDVKPLQKRAGDLRKQRAALAADLDVDLEFATARDRRLRDELSKIEAEIAAKSSASALGAFASGREPGEVWAEIDIAARREVIREMVTVEVLPANRGRRPFDPATVRVTPR